MFTINSPHPFEGFDALLKTFLTKNEQNQERGREKSFVAGRPKYIWFVMGKIQMRAVLKLRWEVCMCIYLLDPSKYPHCVPN